MNPCDEHLCLKLPLVSLSGIPEVLAPCFPGWPPGFVCCGDEHCVSRHNVSCDACTSSPPDQSYSARPVIGQKDKHIKGNHMNFSQQSGDGGLWGTATVLHN